MTVPASDTGPSGARGRFGNQQAQPSTDPSQPPRGGHGHYSNPHTTGNVPTDGFSNGGNAGTAPNSNSGPFSNGPMSSFSGYAGYTGSTAFRGYSASVPQSGVPYPQAQRTQYTAAAPSFPATYARPTFANYGPAGRTAPATPSYPRGGPAWTSLYNGTRQRISNLDGPSADGSDDDIPEMKTTISKLVKHCSVFEAKINSIQRFMNTPNNHFCQETNNPAVRRASSASSQNAANNGRGPSRGRQGPTSTVIDGINMAMPKVILGLLPFVQPDQLDKNTTNLSEMKGFKKSTLINLLDLYEWSFDFYRVKEQTQQLNGKGGPVGNKRTKYGIQGCYLLDYRTQPYCPANLCQHGATLVPFVRDQDEKIDGVSQSTVSDSLFENFAVFVTRAPGPLDNPNNPKISDEPLYWYVGHYSQPRYSDKLDSERIQEKVPKAVQWHWACVLANKSDDRPNWVLKSMKKAIYPAPDFEAAFAKNSSDQMDRDAETACIDYGKDMQAWEEEAQEKLDALTPQAVMHLFKVADLAATPGLRFYWEYLQAKSFQKNLYYVLRSEADGNDLI
ncbi:MAG: hypothetical protein M1831_007125 [Alyxoria varia]|nr:MAG: hypothetical protein M1831_007125 [Alyxoria varia]